MKSWATRILGDLEIYLIIITSAFGASGLMFGWHVHATESGTQHVPHPKQKMFLTWVCIQN